MITTHKFPSQGVVAARGWTLRLGIQNVAKKADVVQQFFLLDFWLLFARFLGFGSLFFMVGGICCGGSI